MPHPYTTTVQGLNTLIDHLRLVLPVRLTPETLRTWDIGRSNESSLLATLRFLRVVDADRNTQAAAKAAFSAVTDQEFSTRFASMVREAYAELFAEFGESAWTLSRETLVAFMRQRDGSGARVADQQAMTFQALARHAGRGQLPARTRSGPSRRGDRSTTVSRTGSIRAQKIFGEAERQVATGPLDNVLHVGGVEGGSSNGTVKISINLPLSDDPTLYDEIFRSLRRYLLNR